MRPIGGFFCFDPLKEEPDHYFDSLVPAAGDLRYLMSGRCANYYALKDILLTDQKKAAYVPLYTCETVIAPFIKAGYEIYFYEFTKDMTPVFDDSVIDKISVISICGYYGFCNYDRDFVRRCHDRGVIVLEDTTHSIFSKDGLDPYCDYAVGSLRKWIGVPAGGYAIKMQGRFSLTPKTPNLEHLAMRIESMEKKQAILASDYPDEAKLQRASDTFWQAELMLRQIFDDSQSDERSVAIIKHFDFERLIQKRRENYSYLAGHIKSDKQLTVVFPELTEDAVPSHFTLYAEDRADFKEVMERHGIHAVSYWPKGPLIDLNGHKETAYIYNHVISLPCDQRYGIEEMQYIHKIITFYQNTYHQ